MDVNPRLVTAGQPYGFVIQCGLYMASIIIGAGVLGLPTLTATVGLLPAVGMTVLFGLAMTFVYVRIAGSIHAAIRARVDAQYAVATPVLQRAGIGQDAFADLHRDLGSHVLDRKGAGIFDAVCAWLGFGRAGSAALMMGLLAFVLPALALYITIGGGALSAIAIFLRDNEVPAYAVAAAAAAGLAVAVQASRRPPNATAGAAIVALLQMGSSWLAGIAILMVVPAGTSLGVLLFATAIAGMVFRTGSRHAPSASHAVGRVEPAHQLGAIITVINVALLCLTGVLALILLRSQGGLATPDLFAPAVDIGDVVKTGGGLLFAYTGTGVFNLIRYPSLFERDPRQSTSHLVTAVILGTLIATVAYAGWMVSMAYALSPVILLQADNDRSYATVALARTLAGNGPAGSLVFLCGYAVALLAVTSAAIGFSESLAERLARVQSPRSGRRYRIDAGDLPERWRIRRAQLGVLALTTGAALAIQHGGDGFAYRDILSVAGYAGGGLLLLVLPFFIPVCGRGRASRRDVAMATGIALALATLNVSELQGGFGEDRGDTVAGVLVIGVTVGFLASVIWLLVESSPGRSAGNEGAADSRERPNRLALREDRPW